MPEEWSPTTIEIEKAWARYEMLQDLAAELWNRYEDMFLSQMIDDGPFRSWSLRSLWSPVMIWKTTYHSDNYKTKLIDLAHG